MKSRGGGFTLIELSIVLVIIGLIVGGVLVGQDLIRAAYVRAQISQIEKFNTAVNTFYGKFQALPGDMSNGAAQTFGFSMAVHNAPGGTPGQGDGNGILDGVNGQESTGTYYAAVTTANGELGVFWNDLSSSVAGNLIEGTYPAAVEGGMGSPLSLSPTQLPQWLPPAKISSNFVYITEINGTNFFGIEAVQSVIGGAIGGVPGLTVSQAYSIDRKVDDGVPTTGNVVAMASYYYPLWLMAGGASDTYVPAGSLFSGIAATAGNAAGPTTCFDAPTVGGATNYSMEINGGAGLNCALLFKMQGGD